MQLTIVIPTYNEADNLPKMISALFELPIQDLKLIIVDDNSPDQTGLIADDYADQIPGRISVIHRAGKLGLGSAYIQGFRKAIDDGAEAIGQMDADFSHSPEKIIPIPSLFFLDPNIYGFFHTNDCSDKFIACSVITTHMKIHLTTRCSGV